MGKTDLLQQSNTPTLHSAAMPFYFGDIHNHCGISYGHGSLEDAYTNAKLQLDFASVTGHSSWPDMPEQDERLQSVVEYHRTGFQKLERSWREYLQLTEQLNEPGEFVTFFSYEWHALQYGDYVAYFKAPIEKMLKPGTLEDFRRQLLEYRSRGIDCMLIPHHIGYKTGYRGINWDSFYEDISPAIEIISMHGCAEQDDSPIPYLHTMGPLDSRNTMQAGLAAGKHFGVLGSTDHHSAHPGSYGYGRVGVWAEELSREAIWNAIQARRSYALSGDKIELDFRINDHPMGSHLAHTDERRISLAIKGGYALERVEVLKNNRVILQKSFSAKALLSRQLRGKWVLEMGWGEKDVEQFWDGSITIDNGALIAVEPRLHGIDIVAPQEREQECHALSSYKQDGNSIVFRTSTYGNPTPVTNANQAFCFEIEGSPSTTIVCRINGREFSYTLEELYHGSRSEYLGDFLTGAMRLHRFMPEQEYCWGTEFHDSSKHSQNDVYYLRVSQRNHQWAWSSPIRFSDRI